MVLLYSRVVRRRSGATPGTVLASSSGPGGVTTGGVIDVAPPVPSDGPPVPGPTLPGVPGLPGLLGSCEAPPGSVDWLSAPPMVPEHPRDTAPLNRTKILSAWFIPENLQGGRCRPVS